MTVIDILLKKRGLTTAMKVKEFFHPADPQTIKFSAARAVEVINLAVKARRPIYIYGDYDADGITATAVLWETLHRLKAQVMPYICPRNDPVRGLSVTGLKTFPKNSLVITVDNGITAFTAAEYAQKQGMELVITDHHQVKDRLPPAAAIVHDTRLAGVGVAWFLAREILRHLRGESSHLGGDILDLAALGTIADMVPLLNINRSLVKFGMVKLRTSSRPGIKILAAQAMIELDKLTPHQVSFSLAPRLNAMGRMDDSLEALRMLCTRSQSRSGTIAAKLSAVNQQRQEQTQSMFNDARQKVKSAKKLIFIQSRSYHEGLVGLVAGRLVEEFHRPAVVVAVGPNHAKGSIRSNKNFDAVKTIRSLEKLVMEHGGHPQAAGFTAKIDQLPKIKQALEQAAAKLTQSDLAPEISYDADLNLDQVNWEFYRQLEKFEPFGFGNPEPVFRAKNVKVVSFYPVGADSRHLKLRLQGEALKAFSAIAFGQGALAAKLTPGQTVGITYNLEVNHWNGKKSLELKIKEISL